MSSYVKPLVHRDGPDTERAAADSVEGSVATVRARVLALLQAAGPEGLTDDEGGRRYKAQHDVRDADRLTFGRRRHELQIAGQVRDSGLRRPTPRGRRAIVWVVTA